MTTFKRMQKLAGLFEYEKFEKTKDLDSLGSEIYVYLFETTQGKVFASKDLIARGKHPIALNELHANLPGIKKASQFKMQTGFFDNVVRDGVLLFYNPTFVVFITKEPIKWNSLENIGLETSDDKDDDDFGYYGAIEDPDFDPEKSTFRDAELAASEETSEKQIDGFETTGKRFTFSNWEDVFDEIKDYFYAAW